jgi:hypothetical protein
MIAAAIPDSSRAALSPEVNMTGRNSGEISESARDTAVNKSGAARSATAYHRAPTRHLVSLVRRRRRPALPLRMPVNPMLATLGPASIASPMNGSRGSDCHVVPDLPPGATPTTRRTPPHEIANVRAK